MSRSLLFSSSPAYHVADKSQQQQHDDKPPLALPEADATDINGIIKANDVCGGRLNSTNQSGDSVSPSPLCISAPVDISSLLNLPQNLASLYGRPNVSRRIEKDKKIVLYVLAADDSFQTEKGILQRIQSSLLESYRCKGFEIHVSDIHVPESYSKSNTYDLNNWLEGPLEAQCGHHLAANCLAEITSKLIFDDFRLLIADASLSLQDIQTLTLFQFSFSTRRSATRCCR
jgi:hypothetical protein